MLTAAADAVAASGSTLAPRGAAPVPAVAPLALPDETTRADAFDRRPYGFTHRLHELDLFRFDALVELAGRLAHHPHDALVAEGALAPQQRFDSVPQDACTPQRALEQLDAVPRRVLLKRPERHDPRYAELLRELFADVAERHPQLHSERIVRLESAIFISSGRTVTPFHFDAESAFFSQIEGGKQYHVYLPDAVDESLLESFYARGATGVGHLDLARCDPAREYVFRLRPGHGFHQPHDAPHWVETGAGRSVSYSFVFETVASRRRCRTRAFNHWLRGRGVTPPPIGAHPLGDTIKAAVMRRKNDPPSLSG
ncbi:MAG TPA: hypothetical protein VM369_00040 [Candidatus Binatia bacterium]|nr:hypothetical protein [Candidatus Binatia bacterium]